MRNVLDKTCSENQNTHFIFNNIFFPENRAVYETMSKTLVQSEATNDVTVWRVRVACCISKTTHARSCIRLRFRAPTHARTCTHTHTQTDKYVILIAFPRQR
jgi:hypothetical protein